MENFLELKYQQQQGYKHIPKKKMEENTISFWCQSFYFIFVGNLLNIKNFLLLILFQLVLKLFRLKFPGNKYFQLHFNIQPSSDCESKERTYIFLLLTKLKNIAEVSIYDISPFFSQSLSPFLNIKLLSLPFLICIFFY